MHSNATLYTDQARDSQINAFSLKSSSVPVSEQQQTPESPLKQDDSTLHEFHNIFIASYL